ncbi:MAG TPA: hypothetical protein VGE01_08305, partial [Fimbriimonas sp.]
VRDRQRIKESAASIESLGLPSNRPNIPLFATLSLAAVVLVGLIAYFIGQSMQAKREPSQVVTRVEAPEEPGSPPRDGVSNTPVPAGPVREPQMDRELRALVTQRSTVGGNLVSIHSDPRSRIVTATFTMGPTEDGRRIAAELARSVLDQSQETLIVTLRGVRDDQIIYMADVPRSRYAELQTGSYSEPPEAWINHILTNEWQPSQTPVSQPSTPPTDAQTPGTASPPDASTERQVPEFMPPLTR